MDVKQIQYFSLVSSTGSFNAAAKQLYISVPGLVKAMDRLENELGVQLFVRRRSGVTLTPAGAGAGALCAALYPQIRDDCQQCPQGGGTAGDARGGLHDVGHAELLPAQLSSRFVLSNPDMSLSTHNYSLQELEDALNEYRETIGLYFGRIDDPELEILFHREAPLRVLMSSTHALCEKAALRMEDLRGCKVILVNSDPEVMRQLQNRLESVGCPPQIMLDGAEWEQAVELIQSAGYISFCLPPGNLSNARLQTREIEDLGLTLDFNMAVMRGVAMTDAERRFVEYVVQMMTANHGGDGEKKR